MTPSSLLLDVLEDPDDLTRKAVYADHLLERGEPQGEYIALSLANRDPTRQRLLFNRHHKEWLGPDLAKILQNPVFHHGFLRTASLRGASKAPPETWRRALRSPLWRTVKTLLPGRATRDVYAKVLSTSDLRSVVEVKLGRGGDLIHLLSNPTFNHLDSLRFTRPPTDTELEGLHSDPRLQSLPLLQILGRDAHERHLSERAFLDLFRRSPWRPDRWWLPTPAYALFPDYERYGVPTLIAAQGRWLLDGKRRCLERHDVFSFTQPSSFDYSSPFFDQVEFVHRDINPTEEDHLLQRIGKLRTSHPHLRVSMVPLGDRWHRSCITPD